MFKRRKEVYWIGSAIAQEAARDAKKQSAITLGDDNAKHSLVLTPDKNGDTSKREFVGCVGAESDRLDSDKSGELDAKRTDPVASAGKPASSWLSKLRRWRVDDTTKARTALAIVLAAPGRGRFGHGGRSTLEE